LTGDALIVLAFQALALGTQCAPQRLAPLVMIISRAVGMPSGIVAGQARECEPQADLSQYHLQKTGALFAAAAMAGAAAAGSESAPWRVLGEKLGLAYQVADDIRDVASTAEEAGKPIGQDARHGRPSVALELGVSGAVAHLDSLIEEAVASIPSCAGGAGLRALIQIEARRFLPEGLARLAA
jgi:geranylgeranyl diphosphate synthase type II